MPRYLIEASYSVEGTRGLIKEGGTARHAAVQKMVDHLGGRLEAFYFGFGENDVYILLALPANVAAAALSLTVAATGAVRTKTTVLLTPEEIDQAVQTPVDYEAPRWEAQEGAKDLDRMTGEGGRG
jgi:uncharacterized protein with GYD domain